MKSNNKVGWRKLDNSAKFFPSVSSRKFSSVFRLSVLLNETINPDILELSVNQALEKFISFKVKLRRGIFWYYLEFNSKVPVVEEENDYPCRSIDFNANNNYLFKVTYFKNKINIDIFHALTDGNTAMIFFKEIVYNYIENSHKGSFKLSHINNTVVINNTEDSYLKNYNKHLGKRESSKKAYVIKGKKLPLSAIGVTHGAIKLQGLKEICKLKNVTITGYLTAVLIKSIYEENLKKYGSKLPIKICIPVNLKKYFKSHTMSNFFSYITLQSDLENNDYDDFDKIIKFVKSGLEEDLKEDKIIKTMSANVKWGNNIVVKLVPLVFKNIALKITHMIVSRYSTTTLSNLGKIEILPEYEKYIDKFLFLLAPEKIEKIKCSVCSYKDELIFSFASIIEETNIEKAFFNHFKELGIEVEIENNGVQYDIS